MVRVTLTLLAEILLIFLAKFQGKPKATLAQTHTVEDAINIEPQVAHYERYLELIRRLEFPEKQSRYQSFFAFDNLQAAKEFLPSGREKAQIFRVQAANAEKKDQNLIEVGTLAQVFSKGRRYWRGDKSENPDWEVLLEPPVEVVEKVELE